MLSGITPTGKKKNIAVTETGQVVISGTFGGGSGGGSGDASAENQNTQTTRLEEIRDRLPSTGALSEGTDIVGVSIPIGGTGARGWLSAVWKGIDTIKTILSPTVLTATISFNLSGDHIILPANSTKGYKVWRCYFTSRTEVGFTLKNSSTALSGKMFLTGAVFDLYPPLNIPANSSFTLTTDAAAEVGGIIFYSEV